MKVRIADIKKNPFRDLEIYPIDDEQVERIGQRLHSEGIGMFHTLPMRPAPDGKGYELAAGHHRLAAAKWAGLKEIEATIENYSDDKMVEVMTVENLTQRAHLSGALTDSVSAYSRLISKQVMLGEGELFDRILSNPIAIGKAREGISKEGPGRDLLYRVLNQFDRRERTERKKVNKDAETVSQTELQQALGALKDSGKMAEIVSQVYEEVEIILAERDEAERQRLEETANTEEQRKAEAKRKKDKERRDKEREEVDKQKADEVLYDKRCINIFSAPSHEDTFRKAVLTKDGEKFIGKDGQLSLAKEIKRQIDIAQKRQGRVVGSPTIKQMVNDQITKAVKAQREINLAEKQATLARRASERVEGGWKRMFTAALRFRNALEDLAKEQDEWDFSTPFPYDAASIDRIGDFVRAMTALKKRLER